MNTDFDFLHGRWRVHHRKLKERLTGCTEWLTLTGTAECHPVLRGLGNVDRLAIFDPRHPERSEGSGGGGGAMSVPPGPPRSLATFGMTGDYEGLTVRLFDLARQVWTIHWADSRTGRLDPPLEGRFEDGRGIFFGDDQHEGRPVRVRFIWNAGRTPRWEQAFSTDGGATWETNWIMDFERDGDG